MTDDMCLYLCVRYSAAVAPRKRVIVILDSNDAITAAEANLFSEVLSTLSLNDYISVISVSHVFYEHRVFLCMRAYFT